MPSNQTPNYSLSQWSRDDRVLMEDFNADNAKIDAALGEHAAALAALTEASPRHGNCQIYITSYKGDGTNSENFGESHPNSLTFPKKPALVFIFTSTGGLQMTILPFNSTHTVGSGNRTFTMHITWNGNTVTWYTDDVFFQSNWFNYTYHVFAFCPMD